MFSEEEASGNYEEHTFNQSLRKNQKLNKLFMDQKYSPSHLYASQSVYSEENPI